MIGEMPTLIKQLTPKIRHQVCEEIKREAQKYLLDGQTAYIILQICKKIEQGESDGTRNSGNV